MRQNSIILIILALFATGCSAKNCHVEDLMIEDNFVPLEITMKDSGPIDEYSKYSNLRMIYTPSGEIDIKHIVSIENFSWSARLTYDKKRSTFFSTDQYRGPWITPENITFRSPLAEQYYVACGQFVLENSYYCRMTARYGKIFTFLSARISDNGTSLEKYQELLQLADKRMIACIK